MHRVRVEDRQSDGGLTVERGVGQEGGRPVGEAWAGPGLDKGLGGGRQRGWGREITHTISPRSTTREANVTAFVQCDVTLEKTSTD